MAKAENPHFGRKLQANMSAADKEVAASLTFSDSFHEPLFLHLLLATALDDLRDAEPGPDHLDPHQPRLQNGDDVRGQPVERDRLEELP